jgi:hypothetical protein
LHRAESPLYRISVPGSENEKKSGAKFGGS